MSVRGLIPLGFMQPGEGGVLSEIRGLRHHNLGGSPECHAGPSKGYRRGHLFHGDRGHRLEHRLNHMGLVPGARVKVMQNNAPGPVIVAVKGSRLCLGRGIACKLMVDPDGDPRSGTAARPGEGHGD
jgi:ferrous iron transport protein A